MRCQFVGTLVPVDAPNGIFRYELPAGVATSLPPGATGTFVVGIEGSLQLGATRFGVRGVPPVLPFAVTDATPQPRRQIVSSAKCNGCHVDIQFHGGSRKHA